MDGAPAARAARGARRRRPRGRGRGAAGGLPQPDGRRGPARRRRRAPPSAPCWPCTSASRAHVFLALPLAAFAGALARDARRLRPRRRARDAPTSTACCSPASRSRRSPAPGPRCCSWRPRSSASRPCSSGWRAVSRAAAGPTSRPPPLFVLAGRGRCSCCWAARSTCCRSARTRPRRSACRSARRAWACSASRRSWRGPRPPSRDRCRSSASWPPTRCGRSSGRWAATCCPRRSSAARSLVVLADLGARTLSARFDLPLGAAHRLRRRSVLPAGAARQRGSRVSAPEVLLRRAASRSTAGDARVLADVEPRASGRRGAGARRTERRRQVDPGARAGRPARGGRGRGAPLRPPARRAGRGTPWRDCSPSSTSEEEGAGRADRRRARRARPLSAPRPVPAARRDRTTRRWRAPSSRPGSRALAERPPRHALGRRAPARHPRARPRPGAAGAAARRARRPSRRRPPAPALPRARRGAPLRRRPCSRWSTTCRAPRPGPTAWCWWRTAASRPRARRARCSPRKPPPRLRRPHPRPRGPVAAAPSLQLRRGALRRLQATIPRSPPARMRG